MLQALIKIFAQFIQQHPELGILGSVFGILSSPFIIIQYLSVILGIIVALITFVVKVIELRSQLQNWYNEDNISSFGYFLFKLFLKIDHIAEKCTKFLRKK